MRNRIEGRVAYVFEDFSDDAFLTGLFTVLVETDDSDPMQGPTEVPASVAIDWARRHAPVVLVTIGNDRYTAGSKPGPEPLPEWHESFGQLSKRRGSRFTYLDRTEESPPIEWNVHLDVAVEGAKAADLVAAFREIADDAAGSPASNGARATQGTGPR